MQDDHYLGIFQEEGCFSSCVPIRFLFFPPSSKRRLARTRQLREAMDAKASSTPRFIDTIKSPQDATRVKVIVLSASR